MSRKMNMQQRECLRNVVARHSPDVSHLLEDVTLQNIDSENRERILYSLTCELIDYGLDSNDEPNKYGLELETIIDIVNQPELLKNKQQI